MVVAASCPLGASCPDTVSVTFLGVGGFLMDTASWHDKSWVVGVSLGGESKAYDWNRLRREGVVNDVVGGMPVVLAIATDRVSFFAFARPDASTQFVARGDSLVSRNNAYGLDGRGSSGTLEPVFASQEFWHSWRTFHPSTTTY